MDYVVGSVAALISGDVTPNRPKLVRRALTPIKHPQSPNVTPKSEFVEDRSIFLSPTLQKKKAIVKKSPKRIFGNTDLDITLENDNETSLTSPNAAKVKKHLKIDLDANVSPKSPKKKQNKSLAMSSSKHVEESIRVQMSNEKTPKKKKSRPLPEFVSEDVSESSNYGETGKSPNKKSNKKLLPSNQQIDAEDVNMTHNESTGKKNRKRKSQELSEDIHLMEETVHNDENVNAESQSSVIKPSKKKNKKLKKKSKIVNDEHQKSKADTEIKSPKKSKNKIVNPNAITDKDTDSEHESDNEIESENEEANKVLLNTDPAESSDEDEPQNTEKPKKYEPATDTEVERTLFVGNVPFSKKVKKEIKKIFNKHGTIETLRIRTIPVKDQRFTPKLAMIKNELHPERSTVNVYIKFKDASSVDKALSENNTVLNEHHLHVSRSNSTGAEHDPKLSVFVGNLPFGLEDESLRSKFQSCGEIVSVRIIRDKKTNAGKGFGYVNFATKDGVELALNMKEEDLTIKNRIIRVKRCTQTQQHGQKKKEFRGNNQSPRNQSKNFTPKNQGGKFGQVKTFPGNKFGGPNPKEEGAFRRIMNKRQNQEGTEGPPDKRPKHLNQPFKEKKPRKEFVGMTSEKKKKHTFNKGQKKKKTLSEILTNK